MFSLGLVIVAFLVWADFLGLRVFGADGLFGRCLWWLRCLCC